MGSEMCIRDRDVGLSCGQVSPLSVLPEYQSKGIGSSLMQAVIEKSKEKGLDALFLLGDPKYYQLFGFTPSNVRSAYGPSDFFQELEIKTNCLEYLLINFYLIRLWKAILVHFFQGIMRLTTL